MTDLADFLLARIAEDETVALAAVVAHPAPWTDQPEREDWMDDEDWQNQLDERSDRGDVRDGAGGQLAYDEGVLGAPAAAHITRHDPARVLVECEAKRRIVDDFLGEVTQDQEEDWLLIADRVTWMNAPQLWLHTLQCLALPYAEHPSYDESWRP